MLSGVFSDKNSEEAVPVSHRGNSNRIAPSRHMELNHSKPMSSLVSRYVRTSIRPSAGEGHVHPHAILVSGRRRKFHCIQKIVRKVRQVPKPARLLVKCQRINRLDFKASDAASLHSQNLALQLGPYDCRTKPPPSHHRTRVIGWDHERLLHLCYRLRTTRYGWKQPYARYHRNVQDHTC